MNAAEVVRYPEVRTRLVADQWRKLEEMARAINSTPPSVVRLLIDKAYTTGAVQIFFEGTNDKSAQVVETVGALVTTD